MRKRIFSRLMAMFMAVALLSTSAFAYVEINQDFIDNAEVTTQEICQTPRTYIDLTNDDYKLTENIQIPHTLRFKSDNGNLGAKATLDLNGYTIDGGRDVGSVIFVDYGVDLTIEDSSGKDNNGNYISAGEGKITGGTGEKWGVDESVSWGGGIYVSDRSSLTLNGGNITGNSAMEYGGGVYAYAYADLTINGGSISDNSAPFGGGVLSCKEINISGGVIRDNHAEIFGGGIVAVVENEIVNITTGGIICGNGDGDHPEHTFSGATCTEPEICTYCGKTRGKPNGHTPGAPARENEVAASAGVSGSYDEVVYCDVCHTELSRERHVIETLPVPVPPVIDVDFPGINADTTISDEETPLAGVLTLADLLNALYEYEEVEDSELPEDFKWADHVYAQAIYWGLEEGLVEDTEDDPLDPDELLTVGLMREVLVNFAEYKGIELTVTVNGEDDEIVMDLSERLSAFYKELEETMEEKAA